MEWQPIESAPIGEDVLVCLSGETTVASQDELGAWQGLWAFGDNTPTHWMPLPEPPRMTPNE